MFNPIRSNASSTTALCFNDLKSAFASIEALSRDFEHIADFDEEPEKALVYLDKKAAELSKDTWIQKIINCVTSQQSKSGFIKAVLIALVLSKREQLLGGEREALLGSMKTILENVPKDTLKDIEIHCADNGKMLRINVGKHNLEFGSQVLDLSDCVAPEFAELYKSFKDTVEEIEYGVPVVNHRSSASAPPSRLSVILEEVSEGSRAQAEGKDVPTKRMPPTVRTETSIDSEHPNELPSIHDSQDGLKRQKIEFAQDMAGLRIFKQEITEEALRSLRALKPSDSTVSMESENSTATSPGGVVRTSVQPATPPAASKSTNAQEAFVEIKHALPGVTFGRVSSDQAEYLKVIGNEGDWKSMYKALGTNLTSRKDFTPDRELEGLIKRISVKKTSAPKAESYEVLLSMHPDIKGVYIKITKEAAESLLISAGRK
ncbi:hypothetical protein [Pseudomonas sp. MWU13-3659]|uniref:hypothetical protein n=1 Tax=Pseudomonas sp. MWU13-3659 TaxID=2986964 RepID=UPI0020756617|nr:hypothetical protein [Pseudomonas sp. MWU13-3659]